jgi:hypothetical protein
MQPQTHIVALVLPLIALGLGVTSGAQADVSFSDVQSFDDDALVDGSSLLVRTETGVAMTINTKDLQPQGAYTTWWVTFNNPAACATPCECMGADLTVPDVDGAAFWATGRVADRFGQAEFAANTDFGELPERDDQVLEANEDGIQPGAEIHLVVRSHGRALGRFLEDQLTTLNGGCPPNECLNEQLVAKARRLVAGRTGADRECAPDGGGGHH